MNGFGAFLGKEVREIFRTWRIWVLPGMMLFFALTSPVIALITPTLVASVFKSESGITVQLPDPTALDAYGQFLKNLDQLFLLTLIIATAGVVSGERRSGTAVLVLTKPLSRRGFILAKILSQEGLVLMVAGLGTAVCLGLTEVLFDDPPAGRLLQAIGLWLALVLLMVPLMVFLSTMLPTQGAAGAGVGMYFLFLLLGLWPPAARFTFAGLSAAEQKVLTGGDVGVTWPIVTAILAAALFSGLAIWRFERAEL